MISLPRDIFSDAMSDPASKPRRAPVVDAASFDETREYNNGQAARTRELWASVLLTAINDAADPLDPNHPSSEKLANQGKARSWLDRGGKDFRKVCELAGVDPDAVHENWRSGKITRLTQAAGLMRGPYSVKSVTGAGIDHLQRTAGQLQREVWILQGDGAGKQVWPLVGKFKGVK